MAQLKDLIVNGASRFIGPVLLNTDPTADLQAATKHYVDSHVPTIDLSGYLPLTGGTITGNLTVNQQLKLTTANSKLFVGSAIYGNTRPSSASEGQVFFEADTSGTAYLPIAGGTLTGNLTLQQKLVVQSPMYGISRPSSAVEGQLFFEEDSGVALPAGGTAGQFLKKNSSTDGDASWATPNYLPLSGGTMSGSIDMATTPGTRITGINGTAASSIGQMYTTAGIQIRENGLVGSSQSDIRYAPTLGFHWGGRVAGNLSLHSDHAFYFYTHLEQLATVKAGSVWGAVWNDYAEFRQSDTTEPGRCIVEVGDDTLELSTERMQPGAEIISDTFGFAIGETDACRTPIATSGRVLAYPFEDIEEFRKNIGHPVCSGPNGTVSIMTDEEYERKAYCSIGTISAVPDYETWGTGNVKVDGRVWIRVK